MSPHKDYDHADPYRRRFHVPKWNGAVRVTQVPSLFGRLPEFAGWTRVQHKAEAIRLLQASRVQDGIYQRKVRIALKRYGNHGPLICAVVRDHFPESVKVQLRMAYGITELQDRSLAHWQAAGCRLQTWRQLHQAG